VSLQSYYLPLAVIGGVTGELLNQNAQTLHQISANLASYQVNTSVMISLFHTIFFC
jgi:Na+/glutamate symporter